jgi:hypothetical protein
MRVCRKVDQGVEGRELIAVISVLDRVVQCDQLIMPYEIPHGREYKTCIQYLAALKVLHALHHPYFELTPAPIILNSSIGRSTA